MAVNWSYYNKFEGINDKYLPACGEGETKATQIVTAVNKLIYKWYNDGDVYDNTHGLEGWCNDLSSYANWLYEHTDDNRRATLLSIFDCSYGDKYEDVLKNIADTYLDEKYLKEMEHRNKVDTIYDCTGIFKFVEEDRYF